MQINKPDNTLQNISVGSKEINAARVAFFLPGFVISTWAPMIPMVKARLKLEADFVGGHFGSQMDDALNVLHGVPVAVAVAQTAVDEGRRPTPDEGHEAVTM